MSGYTGYQSAEMTFYTHIAVFVNRPGYMSGFLIAVALQSRQPEII